MYLAVFHYCIYNFTPTSTCKTYVYLLVSNVIFGWNEFYLSNVKENYVLKRCDVRLSDSSEGGK